MKYQAEGKGTAAAFPPSSPLQANTAPYSPAPRAALPGAFWQDWMQSSLGWLAVLECSRLHLQGFLESALLIDGLCGLYKEEMAMV